VVASRGAVQDLSITSAELNLACDLHGTHPSSSVSHPHED
jgi:hypothetical protein